MTAIRSNSDAPADRGPLPQRARPPVPGLRLPLGRRRLGGGAVASMVVHGVLLFLLLYKGTQFLAAGAGNGDGPAGGGGGGGRPLIHFLNLPSYSAPQAVTVPPALTVPPITLPDPVKVDLPQPTPVVAQQLLVMAGMGPGTGGGSGPGSGGGQGAGVGPGVGNDSGPGRGGSGDSILASPRRVLVQPAACAGSGQLEVRFWVTEEGKVERVELEPRPKKAECRDELMALMKDTKFYPATKQGRPVASIFSITYSTGH